ncbi:pre-rRNA-processing protein TSR2 homolog [Erpetoichthys calabaricus]|uniref:Pre-rRNA-processing protein TSR2 homolog n=1 Tax=Erpetoichthys calabaricus TaxID=27687 RepID=A0A8C4X8A9_ERPCA|nr:pre-rRNA-processing protein TSR2 homolog [Erpetoichthys calabaricus]
MTVRATHALIALSGALDLSAIFVSPALRQRLPSSKMAARNVEARELFGNAVRAVLETWPVLKIAVENGFGGVYSQQKADWMVGAVQQYFFDNVDLQQYEVEDFLAELLNNEFDTVVEDDSLPQVALQICKLFSSCSQGHLIEVQAKIDELIQKKITTKVNVVAAKGLDEEEEESSEEDEVGEAMDCEAACSSTMSSSDRQTSLPPKEDKSDQVPEDDGWTVVRHKKR